MQFSVVIRVFVISALLLGCEDIDNIEVNASGTTVVPAGSVVDELVGGLDFAGFEGFDIETSQEFQNQGYTRDQIDSMRIRSFTLTVTDPSDGDFDWLTRIRFDITSPDVPTAELAILDPTPDGTSTLDLEVASDLELRDYATAASLTIDTAATGVRPSRETTVRAEVVFDVDIDVSGSI